MRYFTYNEQGEQGTNITTTVAENVLAETFKPRWEAEMRRLGRPYGPTDWLDDWIVVNWAWETDEYGRKL